ncbi:MAG: hypothetical protein LBE03_02635 [Candidatus Nomurabacteria bacterium]|nr:hypothetical protein [Candidatus Nomurabacteria bacterium]
MELKRVRLDQPLTYDFDIDSLVSVKEYLGRKLKDLEKTKLQEAFGKVQEQIDKGFTKNQLINFANGTVTRAYHPVFMAMHELGLSKKPTGVSLSVKTSDSLNVAIRRSLLNGGDRGCLGCVAGFLRKEKSGTVAELVKTNLFGEAGESEEVGFSLKDVTSFGAPFVVDVADQEEVIAMATLNITSSQLLARRDNAKAVSKPNQLIEKDVFFLNDAQVRALVPRAYGAAQHLVALIAPQLGTPSGEAVFNQIRLPFYDRKAVWDGLVPLLDEFQIPHPLFG